MIYYNAFKKIKGKFCTHGGVGAQQIYNITDINHFFRELEHHNKHIYAACGCELEIKIVEII